MRLFIVSALFLITTSAAAQSRWTMSVGPESYVSAGNPSERVWGVRARAEYDLLRPNQVFGLRLETSGRWSPTQSYAHSFSDGSGMWGGTRQLFDLTFGLTASISPLPRARFSPYVTGGVFAVQQWLQWSSYRTGSFVSVRPVRTDSRLEPAGALGVGVRMRVAGRTFQLEYRTLVHQIHHNAGLTFGTRLPF